MVEHQLNGKEKPMLYQEVSRRTTASGYSMGTRATQTAADRAIADALRQMDRPAVAVAERGLSRLRLYTSLAVAVVAAGPVGSILGWVGGCL